MFNQLLRSIGGQAGRLRKTRFGVVRLLLRITLVLVLAINTGYADEPQRVVTTGTKLKLCENGRGTIIDEKYVCIAILEDLTGVIPDGSFGELIDISGGNGQAAQSTPAAKESSPQCGAGTPTTANPVFITTGEKFLSQIDFESNKLYGISLNRTYRSRSSGGTYFGPKWLSTFESYRVVWSPTKLVDPDTGLEFPDSAVVIAPDGSAYTYTYSGPTLLRSSTPNTAATRLPQRSKRQRSQTISDTIGQGYYRYTVRGAEATGELVYGNFSRLTLGRVTHWLNTAGQVTRTSSDSRDIAVYSRDATGLPYRISNTYGQSSDITWLNGRVATVTDSSGRVWRYDYYSNGMLKTVTSPGTTAPAVRTYHYESPTDSTLLTGVSINGVRYSTYKYDSSFRVIESGLSNGEEIDTFEYFSGQTKVTDKFGQSVVYNHTPILGERKITSASRRATTTCPQTGSTTAYDANGYIDYILDWNGIKTDYKYDALGNLIQLISAAGTSDAITTDYVWEQNAAKGWYQIKSISWKASGTIFKRTTYTYFDAGSQELLGRVKSIVNSDLRTQGSRTTNFSYSFHTNGALASAAVTTLLPGIDSTTTVEYDTQGNRIALTNGALHRTTWSGHDGRGLPVTSTDPNGIVSTYSYNDVGLLELVSTALPGGNRVSSFIYDNARNLTDAIYPNGQVNRFRYDSGFGLIKIGNRFSEYATRTYDIPTRTEVWAVDRAIGSWDGSTLTQTISGQPVTQTTILDSLRRTIAVLGNHGQRTDTTYDGNSNPLTVTDAIGRTTTYTWDSLKRVKSIQTPDGGITKFTYDATGGVKTVEDPGGLVTTYTRNGFGQVTRIDSPDSGITDYTYDTAGRLASETRANGLFIQYTWDVLDRLTSRTSNGVTEAFTYDVGTYGVGRLTSVDDTPGRTDYQYTAAGELTQQSTVVYGQTYTTSWQYAANGRMTSMTYPTGMQLTFTYDTSGRVTKISRTPPGGAASTIIDSVLYQPASNAPYAWRHANGRARIATFDTSGRMFRLRNPGIHDVTYGFTTTDTIASMTDALYPELTQSFTYDPNDRLATVNRNNSDNQTFTWDTTGNRRSHTRDGVTRTYGYQAGTNRLTSVGTTRSLTYDAAGNLSTDTRDGGIHAYDAFGRLNTVTVGTSAMGDNRYNALNQRVWKKNSAGAITRFIYDPNGRPLYEIGIDSTSYIWFAGQLIALERTGQIYHAHNDHLGRTEKLSDSLGNLAWRAENAAFNRQGVPLSTMGGLLLGFPGQYIDGDIGLWQNWNRYYDASIGRYTQPDPIGLQGGVSIYSYVNGNPISRVDLNGLYWLRQDWQNPGVVGRNGTPVPPGGMISNFIEGAVPAGYTFGELHDSFVDKATGAGIPDAIANIPSMPVAYLAAILTEILRSIGILDQPKPDQRKPELENCE